LSFGRQLRLVSYFGYLDKWLLFRSSYISCFK